MSGHSSGELVMDFFGAQDQARKRSLSYIFLFIIAVICIITLLSLAIGLSISLSGFVPPEESIWRLKWMLPLAGIVSLFVFGMSFIEINRLRGGGKVLAECLKATPVPLMTKDPDERRLLDIVEETALAAGVPVPEAVIMKRQDGINAFAAGHTLEDAVIGVSEGCIRRLNRDELQGVVAHEFSHIINGDIRVNLRLIGITFGILCVSHLGRELLSDSDDSWLGASNGKGRGGVLVLGLMLMAIGYIGVFFGRLIQTAVSRQREFLADAAAVQFTRNPDGIAGALRKIGGFHSQIRVPYADDTAHLFFNLAVRRGFSSHPPLNCRIRRINPAWDGKYIKTKIDRKVSDDTSAASPQRSKAGFTAGASSAFVLGSVIEKQRRHAQSLRSRIRNKMEDWIHDPEKAVALAFAMILEDDPQIRKAELDAVRNFPDVPDLTLVEEGNRLLEDFSRLERYEILELALGAIRNSDQVSLDNLPARLTTMAEADRQVTLREYLVLYIVRRHLKGHRQPDSLLEERGSVQSYAGPISSILSALAHLQSPVLTQAKQAFEEGIKPAYMLNQHVKFNPEIRLESERVIQDLDRLSRSRFAIRRQILDTAARIARGNNTIGDDEASVLKLISAALGCPMPSVLN